MVSLIETPTRLVVMGTEREMAKLKERFRYRPANYWHADAYQLWKVTGGTKGWDGYRYPLQLKTALAGEILRGRKDELLAICQMERYETNTERCLKSPFPNVTEEDITDDLIQAEFSLDENQKHAVVEWLKNGMGVASMATNAGKTATFAAAAAYIKRHYPEARFLYFTPSERLVKQVFEWMQKFLPGWDITKYGGGKRDNTGKDMVVATQGMLARHFRELDRSGWLKTFHALMLDECVVGQTLVTLKDGKRSIREIADTRAPVVVKSLNETTGQVENNLAWAVRRGVKSTLLVTTANGAVRCSANHPFLTERGWVRADALCLSDSVLFYCDVSGRTAAKILSVEPTGELEEVFDLSVNANHNFFANGILVHNSHHAQSPTAEEVITACVGFFRMGASDTTKEDDPDKSNRICGLCGPIRCTVAPSELIRTGRSAAPTLYLVDIPDWRGKFRHCEMTAQVGSTAWTLMDSKWVKAKYLGPVYDLDKYGNIQFVAKRELRGDKFIRVKVKKTKKHVHRLQLMSGAEYESPSSFTLLDRRYDQAIMRFKERNALIVKWAKYYSDKGWPTVVVATRTPHVLILDALLQAALGDKVRPLIGDSSSAERDDAFRWIQETKGAVLVASIIKEGVSINCLKAGVIADPIADWELARQIVGRFMRHKEENTCYLTWFIDNQAPSYLRNVKDVMYKLEGIEGFTFLHPVAGPETIGQAVVHKGHL